MTKAEGMTKSELRRIAVIAPAAARIALVVTITDVGGLVGRTIIGAMKDRFGMHCPACTLLCRCSIVAALLTMALPSSSAMECAFW